MEKVPASTYNVTGNVNLYANIETLFRAANGGNCRNNNIEYGWHVPKSFCCHRKITQPI